MLKTQELKLFCDKFNLEFPDINIDYQDTYYVYKVSWYNEIIISGNAPVYLNNMKNDLVIYVISELSKWLQDECNFLSLLNLNKKFMR